MTPLRCDCGDTDCPSCGVAQGTRQIATGGRPPGDGPIIQVRPRLDRADYDALAEAAHEDELTPAQWAGRAIRRELARWRAGRVG